MSSGFSAHRGRLNEGAAKAHQHADHVEAHSRNLDANTRGKVLGRGPLGRSVEGAVRPIIDSMIGDMSKAMAKGHRSIGHGLELTRKNLDEAEAAVTKGLRESGSGLEKHGVELRPGQSVPGRQAVRELYQRRVTERVDEIGRQGHAVGRHLRVTDQQLKDRLGTPVMQGPTHDLKPARDPKDGYITSTGKIDPLRGPDARAKFTPPALYQDVEKAPKRHVCGAHSTAFADEESFLYAEQYARGRLDPARLEDQTVLFSPSEAWGPGGHLSKFRGYYIDPTTPFDVHGAVNYKPSDFRGCQIRAVFKHDPTTGGFKLHTMFPEPALSHNRAHLRGL